MNFRKNLFSALLVLVIAAPNFASVPSHFESTTSAKALTEIQSLIKGIEFDFESLDNQTVKVHFLINSANEVVVLRTSNEKTDNLIKANLNYKSLESRDLEVNKVYILPISIRANGNN